MTERQELHFTVCCHKALLAFYEVLFYTLCKSCSIFDLNRVLSSYSMKELWFVLYRSLLPRVPIDYWSFSSDTFGCTKSSHSMLICFSITSSTTTTTTAQKQHQAALEWTTVPPEQRQSEPCPDGSQRDISNPWRAPFSSSDTQPGICFETQLMSLRCTREKAFLIIYS